MIIDHPEMTEKYRLIIPDVIDQILRNNKNKWVKLPNITPYHFTLVTDNNDDHDHHYKKKPNKIIDNDTD